jgi:hypothetical protein
LVNFSLDCNGTLIGELKSISHQVKEDLLEPFGISLNLERDFLMDVSDQIYSFVFSLTLQYAGHFTDHILYVEPNVIQVKFPELYFCEIKDILYELEKVLARASRNCHRLFDFWVLRCVEEGLIYAHD